MNGFTVRRASTVAGIALLAVGVALPASAEPSRGPAASPARTWLSAVAASSARAAWAVGYGGYGARTVGWNGSSWAQEPSPSPSQNAIYDGVAATSARNAWAVGDFSRGDGSPQVLIARWNGSTWRRATVPSITGGGSLYAVTATSARNAWAVGEAGDPNVGSTRTLIVHWNGSGWQRVPSPSTTSGVYTVLLGVAAVSARNAWAVGDSGLATKTLVLHWNGVSWKRVPSPSFAGGADFNGVAAAGGAVWVVGTVSSTPYRTLILRWERDHWVRVPSPSLAADGGGQLFAVAGSGKTAWAVGYAGDKTLVESWNGTAWTRVPSPSPAGFDDLTGVAAVSARDAWAVGESNGRTLILHWNGSSWRQQASH
jgi:hypothetical protein